MVPLHILRARGPRQAPSRQFALLAERRDPALRDDEKLSHADLEICAPPRLHNA